MGQLNDLWLFVLLDLSVLFLCIMMLARTKELTFFHPAVLFLSFHVLVFTLRMISISLGAPTLFNENYLIRLGFEPVRYDEIIRAIVYADIGLFVSTIGFIVAGMVHKRRVIEHRSRSENIREIKINKPLFLSIMRITFVIGMVGLVLISYFPGTETRLIDDIAASEWQSSSWLFITQSWMGVALIGFMYIYGFRRSLVTLMALYSIFQLYQGFHRFRFVLPFLLLLLIYLKQRGRFWPPRWAILVTIALVIVFLPAKRIGRMLQANYPIERIVEETVDYFVNLPTRSTSDLVLMDQFAMTLTLLDNNGQFYYGTTYVPVITLPIPRQFWPQKPEILFYTHDMSTASRPMDRLGMIVTYLGESYANFGILGILFIPYLLAYILGRIYFAVRDRPIDSVWTLIYMMILTSLGLVYRDGLPSLILFTAVSFMPLMIAVGLNLIQLRQPRLQTRQNRSNSIETYQKSPER